jgi:hypothetical protein
LILRDWSSDVCSSDLNDTRAKRAVADAEAQFMRQKWGKLLDTDPCYNPNLTLVHEDFSLGYLASSRA